MWWGQDYGAERQRRRPRSESRDFGYDAAGRLTQVVSDASGASSTTDYTLDGLGNRATTTVDGTATSATVNDLDKLTALGTDAFTYDDAGRLTSATRTGGTDTFDWTSQGELASVTTPSATVGYEYDLAGNIVTRTEGSDTVEFVYDSLTGLPRAVSASDGSWWVYADGVPLAQHSSTGSTAYLHAEIRGDVRVATDSTGAVTDTWTYSVDGQLTARTGTTPVTVGWRGETHDTTTGLIWLRARWYDPATARFLSADPWHGDPSNPISLNRYVYANADPVNMHDPSGLFTESEQMAGVIPTQATLYSIRGTSAVRAAETVARFQTEIMWAAVRRLAVMLGTGALVSYGVDMPGAEEKIDNDRRVFVPPTPVDPNNPDDQRRVDEALEIVKNVNPESKWSRNRTEDLFRVYEIYREPRAGSGAVSSSTFKYGITAQGDDSRPRGQVGQCEMVMVGSCDWHYVAYPQGWLPARLTEQALITAYSNTFGQPPPGNPAGI